MTAKLAQRLFHFPIAILLQVGDAIINAGRVHQAELAARLPEQFIPNARALLMKVSKEDAAQKENAAIVGTLTKEQNASVTVLENLLSRVRDTARRAFRGDNVKLHEEFQVGGGKPGDLGSKLQNARIVLAACKKEDNATALTSKGWVTDDTTKLSQAIDMLDAVDNSQETAKTAKTGTTAQRNEDANELFECLLTLQNAANIQWPETEVANKAIRAEFHLGTFPPSVSQSAAKQAAKSAATAPARPPAASAPSA